MTIPALLNEDAVLGIVRKRLLEVAEVQALVAGRVVGGLGEFPDYGSLPKPAITLLLAGDRKDRVGLLGDYTIELWALSQDSQSAARSIYAAAFAALQVEALASEGDSHRGTIRESGGRREAWFEGAACWYSCGTWRLFVVRDR